ncbi:hypothetical protein, partial [Pseudomonas viridiflava]|uniref:hypothetical protein n=1 Tax=Pseudomonas viridiflava TaxID=33069 RepID=UPI0019D23AC7
PVPSAAAAKQADNGLLYPIRLHIPASRLCIPAPGILENNQNRHQSGGFRITSAFFRRLAQLLLTSGS